MKFIKGKDVLRIELEGAEKVWALHGTIDLPRAHVESAEWREVFDDWKKWELRLPGTYAPGLLAAGSFLTEDGWDFMYVKAPRGLANPVFQKVLVIETNQKRYRRLILSAEHEEAQKVLTWLNRR